jgi:hypothetical protein
MTFHDSWRRFAALSPRQVAPRPAVGGQTNSHVNSRRSTCGKRQPLRLLQSRSSPELLSSGRSNDRHHHSPLLQSSLSSPGLVTSGSQRGVTGPGVSNASPAGGVAVAGRSTPDRLQALVKGAWGTDFCSPHTSPDVADGPATSRMPVQRWLSVASETFDLRSRLPVDRSLRVLAPHDGSTLTLTGL